MKTKATNLTPEQIELAWNAAEKIDGQDSQSIRKDFLGAIIHRQDYNVISKYGWCIEYVLSPRLLNYYGCSVLDAFCEENICVLNIVNYEYNKDEVHIGHYAAANEEYELEYQSQELKSTLSANEAEKELKNEYQYFKRTWDANEARMFALKKKFHLSNEIMRTIFPEYKECNDK